LLVFGAHLVTTLVRPEVPSSLQMLLLRLLLLLLVVR